MSLEQFVQTYGYLAILIGTFVEGEMILVLGGICCAQFQGLKLEWVMLSAFCGSFAGDQLIYYLGRLRGERVLAWCPRLEMRAERVFAVFRRNQNLVILGFRFCYGFRTITPFVIGMSGVRPIRFLLLNAVSAATWAVTISLAGYLLGQAATLLVAKVQHYERFALAGIVLAALLLWLILGWRKRRRAEESAEEVARTKATRAGDKSC